jgi:hypothetical protein
MTHTPGPWEVGARFAPSALHTKSKTTTPIYWYEPKLPPCEKCGAPRSKTRLERQRVVAHVFDGALPGLSVTAKANAQLIAAAPDLLAACEAALADDEATIKNIKAYPVTQSIIIGVNLEITDQLRAAIAKATGQPTTV